MHETRAIDKATSVVFEMEEASTGTTNDGASNAHGAEESPHSP